MKIRKGGIYKTIDAKDFGIYQTQGFEKVLIEEEMVFEEQPLVGVEPVVEKKEEPKVELEVEEKPVIEELPKSKKRKNNR